MAGTPNFLIMEFGGGAGEGLFKEPLTFKEGFLELPQGPGLGVEIDAEGLEAHRHRGPWRQRTMRRLPEDGSFADF
jgi:L-alanine-DL-glutamate epimerase-like enolase superfamily enzyme